ncbi:FMN reductase [Acinetobacter puyangensis]|uniref:FMN reductase n=1 Tax=Acinetobacter puyangensis TaxID=1096779 RepID=A0A240ECU3_9GAMM|nr:FMN reductase [Acinetobacter puyangensis]
MAVARALPILEWAPAKGRREQEVKAKTEQANQNLGINKQIEQDDVLPSVAVPNLDIAEAKLHGKKVTL